METHVTIDFPDDVGVAAGEWTEPVLRHAVRVLAARNVSALHWIDCPPEEGLWDPGGYMSEKYGRGVKMIERIPNPLAVVCDEAHRRNMPVYAVLKPHDLSMGLPYFNAPLGQEPEPAVGLPYVGGTGGKAVRWLRDNPDLRMRIHPALEAEPETGGAINTIRIWHEAAGVPETPEIRLWTSDDNETYRPVDGGVQAQQGPRKRKPPLYRHAPETGHEAEGDYYCVEWSGLNLAAPFVAFEIVNPGGMANRLVAMIELRNEAGESIPFTHGIVPVQPAGKRMAEWRTGGIAFDACRGLPLPGRQCTGARTCLDQRLELAALPCLGIGRGRNTWLTGPVELAYPAVQEHLSRMVRRALDAGADGIDLRFTTHTESLDFENYGFPEPLMAEFQRRYGVDVRRQPFDRALWHTMRGETVDAFVRQAGEIVHGHGRKLFAHVFREMDRAAEDACLFGCRWNWREWIESGLLDGVTFKQLHMKGDLQERLHDLCRRQGIARLCNEKPQSHGGAGPQSDVARIAMYEKALAQGFEVFNLYEMATYCRLGADGKLVFLQPRFWDRVMAGS